MAEADWQRDFIQETEADEPRIEYQSFFDAVFELAWVSGKAQSATAERTAARIQHWIGAMFAPDLEQGKAG